MKYEVEINKEEWKKVGKEIKIRVKGLPSEYKVTTQRYEHKEKEKHCWLYNEIKVNKEGKEIAVIGRNYPSIVLPIYVKQGNNEFLITSGNYMCITILNLRTLELKSYTDEEKYKIGGAFCPIDVEYKGEEFIVSGCVWGGIMERYVFKGVSFNNLELDYNKAVHTEI